MTEYTWDYRNRLTNVKIKNSGGTVLQEVSYRYDPLDRRIGAGTDPDGAGGQSIAWQWTVYDGQNPYADFDNSGSLTNRFLSGDAVDQFFGRMSSSGSTAWYLTDQLGSVRDIANTSGTLIDEVSYDSFGKVLSESSPTNGDRFKFTSRELDPTTGQYYYRARYYDAAVGRFTSQDPIGFASGDTNTYRYAGNSPTFMIDPTGLADTPPSGGGPAPLSPADPSKIQTILIPAQLDISADTLTSISSGGGDWHWYKPSTWPIWGGTKEVVKEVVIPAAAYAIPGSEALSILEGSPDLANVATIKAIDSIYGKMNNNPTVGTEEQRQKCKDLYDKIHFGTEPVTRPPSMPASPPPGKAPSRPRPIYPPRPYPPYPPRRPY